MFGWIKSRALSKKHGQAKRKQQQPTGLRLRVNGRVALVTGLGIMSLMIVLLMPKGEWLPIQKIRISGQFSELDTSQIERHLRPQLGKGFFAVNIEQIQALVMRQPWVLSVSVNRVWPDELSVRIVEKKAVARWDDKQLLSRDGEVFVADAQKFSHLPLIRGYKGQSREVLQRFNKTRKQLLGNGIKVDQFIEDSKGSLTLLLDDGIEVSLGSAELDRKLEQLLAVYETQIKNRADVIRHIDFRYSNGFAIAWKSEYLNQRSEMLQRGDKNV